jgi:hypothetical protein
VVGPLTFVAAWAALGATAGRYDPTRDAISRLAAQGAPTRPAMTAGLVVLGAGMTLYGLALRPDPIWPLPVANGVTALVVAALPLGGDVDTAHGVAATLGYVTLAAIPLAVGRRHPSSVAAGALCGMFLLATVLGDRDGLFQRMGLTVGHAWVVVSSLGLLRSPRPSSTIPPARARAGRRR